MMRSGDRYAVAVRRPDGAIAVTTGDMPTWGAPFRSMPVVRGLAALAEALPVGMRAMRWSAGERRASIAPAAAVLLAAVVVPQLVIDRLGALGQNVIVAQVLDLLIGVGVVVGALAATGRLEHLRRVFQYHGAEHQVVAAHEAGVDLTPGEAARFSTRHPRCGTSLLLWLTGLSLLASLVPGLSGFPLLLPLVIGVAAELQLRAVGAAEGRPWMRHVLRPGLALQRLTTRTPDAEQLEVAIVALQAALASVPEPAQAQLDVMSMATATPVAAHAVSG